jgi:hypothetical protein
LLYKLLAHEMGSILQNFISSENFLINFNPKILGKNLHKATYINLSECLDKKFLILVYYKANKGHNYKLIQFKLIQIKF